MDSDPKILLGRIIKSSGFNGEVTLRLEKAFQKNLPEIESVFLEIEGKAVPFFVSSSEMPDKTLLRLVFEGYDSYEKIKEFIGCRIFLTSETCEKVSENDINHLKGYRIYTLYNELLGTIQEIIENPGQLLLSILPEEGNNILIPLHEDFIVNLDHHKKMIIMDLPDGLTDLNNPAFH